MITDKVDIGGLNRIQLQELRDEVAFELDLRDAELRTLYGTTLVDGHPADDDIWCPVCEDREGEVEDLQAAAQAVVDILSDEDLTEKARIRRAVDRLEQEL